MRRLDAGLRALHGGRLSARPERRRKDVAVRAPLGLPRWGRETRSGGTGVLRAVIPSGARNPPFEGCVHRRGRFFGACAPQNDRGHSEFTGMHQQVIQDNARSAKATLSTMRLRATRKAVTINGQGSRHGKRITRAAALVFFLVTFSKVKKPPGAGRNPASPVPRGAENVWPQGCAACTAGTFGCRRCAPCTGGRLSATHRKTTKDAHERGISISPSHDFSLEATQEGRPRPSWITPMGTRDAKRGGDEGFARCHSEQSEESPIRRLILSSMEILRRLRASE
jgi:hypothetical protein